MRLLFAGTPEVALPSFRTLLDSDRHEVVAVLTRPDAPAGRGRALAASPVKEDALEAGIEVLTPAKPSELGFLARLAELDVDCVAVVAYGALVPQAALDIPLHGWVNLHFSVLPAWRGAAPVQHALLAGDDITGATTFQLEAGLDTGPVYGVMTATVGARETAGELLDRLAVDGAVLLAATIDAIEDEAVAPVPQPDEGVSFAPKLTVDDAKVRWDLPAVVVDRRIRGCTPEPGAWSTFREQRIGIGPVLPIDGTAETLAPGQLLDRGRDGVLVGTATGPVRLGTIRPAGKPDRDAVEWARGARLQPGDSFT